MIKFAIACVTNSIGRNHRTNYEGMIAAAYYEGNCNKFDDKCIAKDISIYNEVN